MTDHLDMARREYAALYDRIWRYALGAFRRERCRARREEYAAECLAILWREWHHKAQWGGGLRCHWRAALGRIIRRVRWGRRLLRGGTGMDPLARAEDPRSNVCGSSLSVSDVGGASPDVVAALASRPGDDPAVLAQLRLDYRAWRSTVSGHDLAVLESLEDAGQDDSDRPAASAYQGGAYMVRARLADSWQYHQWTPGE